MISGQNHKKHPVVRGDRPPSYLSKSALAAELCVSESSVDGYVQRGILPKPLKIGGSVRWRWADVEASLGAQAGSSEIDPFLKGLSRVT